MFDQDFRGRLKQHIGSVWMLELLLLVRETPGRTWTVEALVRELRASDRIVRDGLDRLQRSGFVTREDHGWRAGETGPDDGRFLDELAESFRVSPASLIRLIVEDGPAGGVTRRSPPSPDARRRG